MTLGGGKVGRKKSFKDHPLIKPGAVVKVKGHQSLTRALLELRKKKHY